MLVAQVRRVAIPEFSGSGLPEVEETSGELQVATAVMEEPEKWAVAAAAVEAVHPSVS